MEHPQCGQHHCAPSHVTGSSPSLISPGAKLRGETSEKPWRGGGFGKRPQQLLPPPRLSLSYLQPRLSSSIGRTNRGLAGCRQTRNIAEILRLCSPLEGGSVQGGGIQRVGAPLRLAHRGGPEQCFCTRYCCGPRASRGATSVLGGRTGAENRLGKSRGAGTSLAG